VGGWQGAGEQPQIFTNSCCSHRYVVAATDIHEQLFAATPNTHPPTTTRTRTCPVMSVPSDHPRLHDSGPDTLP